MNGSFGFIITFGKVTPLINIMEFPKVLNWHQFFEKETAN